MGRTVIEILTCDRKSCGEEFDTKGQVTIDELSYMKKRSGSGSMNSKMSLMLCPSCTNWLVKFMEDSK